MLLCAVRSQEEVSVNSISFESSKRGGFRSLTMYERKVIINKDHTAESFILEKGDWEKFFMEIESVDVSRIGDYKPLSKNATKNSSWHSNIVVYSEDSLSYQSQTFNNEYAPMKLEKIMDLFIQMDKKYNKDNRLF